VSDNHPQLDPGDAAVLDRRAAFTAGASATAIALAWLWLISGFFAEIVFLPGAIADLVVRVTPGDVSTFFIDILAAWALRLLAAGVFAVLILAGAGTLWWTRSSECVRPLLAGGMLTALATIVSVAGAPATARVVPTVLATLIAGLIYVAVGGSTYRTLVAPADEPRRGILRLGARGAALIALGGGALGWLVRSLGGPNRDVRLVAPAHPVTSPPADDFPEITGLTPEITSADDHYVVDIDLIAPSVEARGWTLTIDGEVENRLELDFTSLQDRFEVVEEYSTMCCISNEVGGNLIGTSAWGGVRLSDVLEAARPREGVIDLVLRAVDGYSDSIPLEAALDPHTLLTVSQNGEPLLADHGFPCRLRVPSIYGMKNVKWLTGIELVRDDYQGYWMRRGWSDEAIVKSESRIDVAGSDGRAQVGEATWIAGIAWAGERGIERVEVSTDGGGSWREALLKEPINERCWRLWAFRWTPDRSGDVEVLCRATDGRGQTQTAQDTQPHPAGASGYPQAEVSVE
jgi:DMSO/TMAO reductase YedYZ molybdopterin-dependent catalytic subunit